MITEGKLFNPLPWQKSNWQQLQAALDANRLPHAVMMAGEPGIGKRLFASLLGRYLLCQSPREGRPCGNCRSCLWLQAGSHPDFLLVGPEEKGKSIKVDQIRAVNDFLVHTSHVENGLRLVLIDTAESMTLQAANALLKTLEEPTGRTLLLLVSDLPSALMPTIRSRCQHFHFAKPSPVDAIEWLKAEVGDEQRAKLLLDYSGGAPIAARNLLNSEEIEWVEALCETWISVAQGVVSPIVAAEHCVKWPLDAQLDYLLLWFPNWIRCSVLQQWHSGPFHKMANSLRPECLDALLRLCQRLLKLKGQRQAGGNPNPQLTWESLLLEWQALTAKR